MANPDHLKILKDALEKDDISIWNKWRDQNPDLLPDLRGADLIRTKLMRANLRGADLFQANLIGANLMGAKLSTASFWDTDFTMSNLMLAELNRTNISESDLIGVNLNGAKLTDAVLFDSNLKGSSLVYTDLSDADLTFANLTSTNLSNANLDRTNLFKVNLTNANFSEADLVGSEFNGCHLINTNLENAILDNTVFVDVDLSRAVNLDQAYVNGPCEISISTLYKSRKIISEPWFHQFLKDCGVPDIMITYLPSLVEASMSFYSCFISYSTADTEFATKLFEALREKGIRVWFAPEQMLAGQKLADQIDRGITHWDKVILCCSKSSMTEKWWVDFEVEKTFSKSRRLQREWGESVDVLVPLNLDGYVVSEEFQANSAHADVILSYYVEDCTNWRDEDAFNHMVGRIVKSLREDGGNEPPPPSKLKPNQKP